METVERIRGLGIILDANLSFKTHIDKLRIKLSRNVGIIRHLRHLLPYHPMRCIYFSLVHSYTSYCANANTFKTHLHPLQVLQNKVIRILMSYLPAPSSIPDSSSTKSAYKYINILHITLLMPFATMLFVQKYDFHLFFVSSTCFLWNLLIPTLLDKIH